METYFYVWDVITFLAFLIQFFIAGVMFEKGKSGKLVVLFALCGLLIVVLELLRERLVKK